MTPVSASRNTATLLNVAARPTSCVSLASSPYVPATRPASAVNTTMSAINRCGQQSDYRHCQDNRTTDQEGEG